MNDLYMMGIITDRGIRSKMIPFLNQSNIHVVLATLGAGTANSAILDYLGMEATEKAVYFAVVSFNTWKKFQKELYSKMQIDIAGRGIAFLIPLSSIGGKKSLQYLTANQEIIVKEESALKNTEFELLITIANGGHIETVMDAARSAKAPGGTVIHAKGTGAEHARRFLGISLAEEKEMIFIVVRSTQKNKIMRAIMDQAGTGTPAGAVVFSLPVTATAGLRFPEEDDVTGGENA